MSACRSFPLALFQFTHPGKGATSACGYLGWGCPVSIHAPWEGCDSRSIEGLCSCDSFNSRTLGRVRPQLIYVRIRRYAVSIHAPWEGCDGLQGLSRSGDRSFNSRTLGRVRQSYLCDARYPTRVSIHAPWEGCDVVDFISTDSEQFQFTHPGKGATYLPRR